MPRYARVVVRHYPHHIVHKGNGGQAVFLDKSDYGKYLELLKKYSEKWRCGIQAYCLMPNHVHALVVPPDETSLARMMHSIAFLYTQYFNRKYSAEGHLWGNRFYSSVVDADAYHWTAALYIEQNPVRAGLVPSAEMYSYSSARAHARGKSDPVLNASLFDEFDQKEYRKTLREPLTEEQLMETRTQTKLCKPLGSARFIRTVERLLGISIPRNRHSSEKR